MMDWRAAASLTACDPVTPLSPESATLASYGITVIAIYARAPSIFTFPQQSGPALAALAVAYTNHTRLALAA